MKINTIEGTAKIKGKLRTVRYTFDEALNAGALVIAGIEENEVNAIVTLLEGGKAAREAATVTEIRPGVTAGRTREPAAEKSSTKPEDEALAADPEMTNALAAASPAPAPKPPKAPRRGRAAAEAPAENEAEKGEEAPESASAGDAGEAAEEPEAKPAKGSNGAGNGVEVAPELVSARRLRDVVNYFTEQGITDKDALIAECERVKESVPVLARIADIPDRVNRTLEVMDMDPSPA